MDTEKFCLRWNDFETNISAGFRELREEKDFFDVTLACDDSQLQAHKVILSACSPFFRNILRRNPHQHPLLYMKGVKYSELQSVLNFMYLGEVNVAQEDLNSFLSVAEDLKVKGLTQNSSGEGSTKPNTFKQFNKPRVSPAIVPPKRVKIGDPTPRPPPVQEIEEVVHVKSEPREIHPQAQVQSNYPHQQQNQSEDYGQEKEHHHGQGTVALDQSYSEHDGYDYQYEEPYEDTPAAAGGQLGGFTGVADPTVAREEEITSLILRDQDRKVFTCALCPFVAPGRHRVFCHLEAQHFADQPVTYTCQYCGKAAASKNGLCLHISRNHKQEREKSKSLNFSV